MHTFLKIGLLSALWVPATSLLLPQTAQACGGFFCSAQQPVDQAAERILFAKDGDEMVAHVQIQYTGPSENFSWIVPVPSVPKLSIGSDAFFQALRTTTRPSFNLNIERTEGTCQPTVFPSASATATPSAAPSAAPSVSVLSQEQVGPFESVVLQGDNLETVTTWLTENGYDVPPNVQPKLQPYIDNKMPLLALKLRKDRGAGDIQPIVMRYKADKPMIPIQLTAVAATPDMDVQLWILGEHRAIPTNYPHVKINEARLNWQQRGNNYRQLVTDAMNEAGGRGFVTDYAGESSLFPIRNFDPQNLNLTPILRATDPIAFANAARSFFNNNDQYVGFLKRYIAKPGLLEEIEDSAFYNNLQTYAAALKKAEIRVNATAAAQELLETQVKPLEDIQKLFQAHPYLTAMYTTLSPEEMTQDPVFDFNPDLETVSAQRTATGVRLCSPEYTEFNAPVRVTTPSGLVYTLAPNNPFQDQIANLESNKLPAAMVIQSVSAQGMGQVLSDQTQALKTQLALSNTFQASQTSPSGSPVVSPSSSGSAVPVPMGSEGPPPAEAIQNTGSGCACHSPNTPRPVGEGSGEAAAYTLGLLGFWGWRRRRQK